MGLIKRFFCVLLLQLVVLLPSVQSQVEIPFDFFQGRWVEGHYYNGWIKEISDDDNLHEYSDYFFTKGNAKFDFKYLQRYIFFDDLENNIITPRLSLNVRLSPKWQVGINDMMYNKSIYDRTQHGEYSSEINSNFSFDITSDWFNNTTQKLSENFAPYYYLNGNIIGVNGLHINSKLEFEFKSDNRTILNNYIQRYTSNKYENITNFNISNSFYWGLDKYNNLKINMGLKINNSLRNNNSILSILNKRANDQFESNYYIPSYNINFYQSRLAPLYTEISIGQIFISNESKRKYRNIENDSSFVLYSNSDLKVQSTYFKLRLDLINKGEFNPNIILDDYNNYYRNMLFHKQYHIYFSYRQQIEYNINYLNYKYHYFNFGCGLGLLNKYELSFNVKYRGNDMVYVFNNLYEINGSVLLRYRSYQYNRKNNNWKTDSNRDIVFSNILHKGHYYFAFEYKPPIYINYKTEDFKLFEFSNYQKFGNSTIRLTSIIGIGYQSELAFSYFNEFEPDYDEYSYQIELRRRIFDKADINLIYENRIRLNYSTKSIQAGIKLLF